MASIGTIRGTPVWVHYTPIGLKIDRRRWASATARSASVSSARRGGERPSGATPVSARRPPPLDRGGDGEAGGGRVGGGDVRDRGGPADLDVEASVLPRRDRAAPAE